MKIRQRTKNLLYSGLIGALVVAVISTGILLYLYNTWKKEEDLTIRKYEKDLSEISQFAKQQHSGYALKKDIKAGTTITPHMIEEVFLAEKSAAEDLISPEEADGRLAKLNLKAGTVLTASLLTEEELTPDDLRNSEFDFITLPSKLKKKDYVDVRIQFPNGNDYILLSKKEVVGLEGDTVWFKMNEEESLSMSSAIVDAYFENAVIYSLAYVEPQVQEASTVTYPVKQNVLDLILESPNIINVATNELKARGRGTLENSLKSLAQDEKSKFQQKSDEKKVENENKKNEAEETTGESQEDIFTESIEE